MYATCLSPIASPTRRNVPSGPPGAWRRAMDQVGSVDSVMACAWMPPQSGAVSGLDRSSCGVAAVVPSDVSATLFNGPVTESNGLRERIGSADFVTGASVPPDASAGFWAGGGAGTAAG